MGPDIGRFAPTAAENRPLGGPMTRYGSRRSRRPRRYSLAMKLSGWMAIGVTTVLVCGTLYAYAKYRNVWDKIKTENVTFDYHRPKQLNNALNILLIGSDSRAGKNRKLGGYALG